MDLWSLAVIFTLAFLGLVFIVLMLVFVFIAYHRDINLSVRAYPGGKSLLEVAKADKHESLP